MPIKKKTRKSKKTKRQKGGHVFSKLQYMNYLPDDPILPEDILYEDSDVCILKPEVKKGILIFSTYDPAPVLNSLCEIGLKTGAQLKREGYNIGRTIHKYIFFRAPFYNNPIDYTSVDTEISSSYGEELINSKFKVYIRVDPSKTNVYASDIRSVYRSPLREGTQSHTDNINEKVKLSKKSMIDYLKILDKNEENILEIVPGTKPVYNLYTGEVRIVKLTQALRYPWVPYNINTQHEVLVKIQHLTPNYFVRCT
jgi:hypothetical protein